MLKVKYAAMRPYCRSGQFADCARYAAYRSGGTPSDNLLPNGDLDPALSGRPTKVLVVDDIPVFRKLMEGIVGSVIDSAEIVSADGAAEALEVARREPIDLIVTDYNMPLMHGGELVRAVRTTPATSDVPIVIFSTEASEEKRSECLAHGRVRWVAKSPDRADISAAIRELLHEGRI